MEVNDQLESASIQLRKNNNNVISCAGEELPKKWNIGSRKCT